MPFLINDNAEKLLQAFGLEWLKFKTATVNDVQKDLYRTQFLGSSAQQAKHLATWNSATEEQIPYYSHGNMDAANLSFFINPNEPNYPFLKDHEAPETYLEQQVRINFSYVNSHNELCGLLLIFRKDDPSQWFVALSKNTNLTPQERSLFLLSSSEIKPLNESDIKGIAVEPINNTLLEQVDNDFVKGFLTHVIRPEAIIDPRCERIRLITGLLSENATSTCPFDFDKLNPALLFDSVFDVFQQYGISLSLAMLNDYLSADSGLRNEIAKLKLTQNAKIDKCLLQLTITCYEEKILDNSKLFLEEQIFSKISEQFTLNDTQIDLIPFLVKRGYSAELFQKIVASEYYYRAVSFLKQKGITQHVAKYFQQPEKLAQLQYIYQLETTELRELCWFFWAKKDLSIEEYKVLVEAARKNPLLVKALLADEHATTMSIDELHLLALNDKENLPMSIAYCFREEFALMGLTQSALDDFTKDELLAINASFYVLKHGSPFSTAQYKLVLNQSDQGFLLRLLLPSLESVENNKQRQQLIDMAYMGIATQGKLVKKIGTTLALNFHESFICATQLKKLKCDLPIIAFAAQRDDAKAACLRKIILKVEAQCRDVQRQLGESANDGALLARWRAVEKEYRKSLYLIAYNQLLNPSTDLRLQIKNAELAVLNTLEPEDAKINKALFIISNILISLLTLGIANGVKYKLTGNCWFFNQIESGEIIRAVDKEIISLLEIPTQQV